ncbi:MAG: metalloregulator ArsR/SmtB family transcription factor [Candidatus Dormibacteria bacterium]
MQPFASDSRDAPAGDPAGFRAGGQARAASLLQALGNPIRLAIVRELAGGGLCVHELVDRLGGQGSGIAQPLVSQHLRVLRSARVVVAGRRGKENLYELVDSEVAGLVARALEHTRRHP